MTRPAASFARLWDELERELRCPICLDTVRTPFTLECSHTFCKECILLALSVKAECPSCREPASRRSACGDPYVESLIHQLACVRDTLSSAGLFESGSTAHAIAPPSSWWRTAGKERECTQCSKPMALESQPGEGLRCDGGCNRPFVAGMRRWACSDCDLDICEACNKKRFLSSGGAGGHSEDSQHSKHVVSPSSSRQLREALDLPSFAYNFPSGASVTPPPPTILTPLALSEVTQLRQTVLEVDDRVSAAQLALQAYVAHTSNENPRPSSLPASLPQGSRALSPALHQTKMVAASKRGTADRPVHSGMQPAVSTPAPTSVRFPRPPRLTSASPSRDSAAHKTAHISDTQGPSAASNGHELAASQQHAPPAENEDAGCHSHYRESTCNLAKHTPLPAQAKHSADTAPKSGRSAASAALTRRRRTLPPPCSPYATRTSSSSGPNQDQNVLLGDKARSPTVRPAPNASGGHQLGPDTSMLCANCEERDGKKQSVLPCDPSCSRNEDRHAPQAMVEHCDRDSSHRTCVTAPCGIRPPSYPQSDAVIAGPTHEEVVCCVCREGESFESDPIIFCDGCDIAIHKDCHYLPKVPSGNWFCDCCVAERAAPRGKRLKRRCAFCPSVKGAFKRTHKDQWGGWAHMVCTQFYSTTGFVQTERLTEAAGFDNDAMNDFKRLKCSLCPAETKAMGAKVQCTYPRCLASFHPTCALEADFCVKHAGESNRHGFVDHTRMTVLCAKHSSEERAWMRGEIKSHEKSRRKRRKGL